nr:secrectory protein [Plasmodiophora brassicae]
MARSFVAAVTVAMALALAAAQVPVTSKFKFGEFFRGEFDVVVSKGDVSQGYNPEPSSILKLNVSESAAKTADSPKILFGESFINNTETGAIHDRGVIEVEFNSDDLNSGAMKAGKDDGPVSTLYEFHFDVVPNGVAISTGHFKATPDSPETAYTFQINSWDSFTFTSVASDGKVTFWFGQRVKTELPKSFLSKYGSTLLLVAVFGFNMLIQRKLRKDTTPNVAQKASEAKKSE